VLHGYAWRTTIGISAEKEQGGATKSLLVRARARLKDSTEWHAKRLADVFTFGNGKAIQMRAFADRR
jgi:hypothetical protein